MHRGKREREREKIKERSREFVAGRSTRKVKKNQTYQEVLEREKR